MSINKRYFSLIILLLLLALVFLDAYNWFQGEKSDAPYADARAGFFVEIKNRSIEVKDFYFSDGTYSDHKAIREYNGTDFSGIECVIKITEGDDLRAFAGVHFDSARFSLFVDSDMETKVEFSHPVSNKNQIFEELVLPSGTREFELTQAKP